MQQYKYANQEHTVVLVIDDDGISRASCSTDALDVQAWLSEGNTPDPYEPPPPAVPDQVTMRQARLALHSINKLTLVQAAIDSLPEPPKTAAQIEWEYSSAVKRHNGFVSQMAPALGMSEADIDALFIAAAKIV